MVSRRTFNALLGAGAVATLAPELIRAQSVTQAKNIVLVHGLYADGSSWLEVIPRLQSAGLKVTAVQNPLMSIAEDAAATRHYVHHRANLAPGSGRGCPDAPSGHRTSDHRRGRARAAGAPGLGLA